MELSVTDSSTVKDVTHALDSVGISDEVQKIFEGKS